MRFIFEDSQYDNKLAIAAFNRLVEVERCAVILCWGSGPSEAVAPVAERRKVPLFTVGEHTAALGRTFVINFTNPSGQLSAALARVLHTRGYQKLSLVMTDITYFRSLSETLRASLAPGQQLRVVATYAPSDSDFRSTISKLKTLESEAVVIFLLPGNVSQFYRQMGQQALQVPTFGSDIFESASEIRSAGPAMEGALFAHHMVSDDFRKRYVIAFGNDVHLPTAARMYDFAELVLKEANSGGGERWRTAVS